MGPKSLWWGRLGLGLAALVTSTVVGVAPPSAAQTAAPTITVTPSGGLVDGQTVEVEVTGMTGEVVVSQCSPDQVNTVDGELVVYFAHCRNRVVPDASGSFTVELTLEEAYETTYRGDTITTRCGGAGPDCFVTAVETTNWGAVVTPVHFGPPRPDPAVTVTPSSGLEGGDVVEVEVTGFGAEPFFYVGQCTSEVVDAPDPEPLIQGGSCGPLTGGSAWDDPWTGTVTIAEAWAFDTGNGVVGGRCRDEPGSCVIMAFAPESNTLVAAPLDVDPGPLAVVPTDQEAGFPVYVFPLGRPGATLTVAQCAGPVRRTLAASRCSGASPVTLDARGQAMLPFELREAVGRRHRRISCLTASCAVALFGPSGRTIGSVPVVVYAPDGPPVVASVEPTTGLVDGQQIEVTITGIRNDGLWLAQCDSSVVMTGDVETGPCQTPMHVTQGREDDSSGAFIGAAVSFTGADGSAVHCGDEPGDCVIAAESLSGELLAAVPISFAPPPP